jgi:hypothetical protein
VLWLGAVVAHDAALTTAGPSASSKAVRLSPCEHQTGLALVRSAPMSLAPMSLALVSLALVRSALVRSA